MATNSRRQKRHQVKSMPLSDQPTFVEAWPSDQNTLETRRRNSERLPHNPRLTTLQQTNFGLNFNTSDSDNSLSKPIPPAHGVAPKIWSTSEIYQPVLRAPPIHQGNTMKRNLAWHPRRIDGVDGLQVKELMRVNPLHLFFTGFLPPFFGAVASIVVALILHNDEISNYNWQCGRARLPSLSRIINLPMERIFWQFTFLFHIPLRLVELAVGFYRYGRLRSKMPFNLQKSLIFNNFMYAVVGIFELIFMVALSVVGEREFIGYHVIFFYAFGSCAIGFFITNVICHANSLYYLNPYGRISYYTKSVVLVLYIISVPILLGSFILYWKQCITDMYDIFAITEYVDVFLSIAYHCCAFFDIRYKVVFSIRSVKHAKYD